MTSFDASIGPIRVPRSVSTDTRRNELPSVVSSWTTEFASGSDIALVVPVGRFLARLIYPQFAQHVDLVAHEAAAADSLEPRDLFHHFLGVDAADTRTDLALSSRGYLRWFEIAGALTKRGYEVSTGIAKYVAESRPLFDALMSAPEVIRNILGPEAQIALDLLRDPEEGWTRLYLVIVSSLPPEQAIEKEDVLVDTWLGPMMDRLDGRLSLTVEPA